MTTAADLYPNRKNARKLRADRYSANICVACGLEPRRTGKQLGQVCADRNKIRARDRCAAKRVERHGYTRPNQCDECLQLGHTAKTCTGATESKNGQCLRCTQPAVVGPLCREHDHYVTWVTEKGWLDECEDSE